MQTSVLETYNQLTVQDQEKVTTFIYSLFSKYKKTSARKTLSAEDEELFNHFTGSLSLDSESPKTQKIFQHHLYKFFPHLIFWL
ncbi:hypothetical protein [Treponema succinifaciens]|uniref:hypothetical protein n=1 Tax=Treponema succinifaciens TaxID=167 RepID=UPI003FCC88E3